MADYPIESQLVINSSGQLIPGGKVYVYDSDDTGNTTPLALTDPNGLPINNPLTASPISTTPEIRTPVLLVKMVGENGAQLTVLSAKGVVEKAEAAVAQAASAAFSAQQAADDAASSAALVQAPADTVMASVVSASDSATRAAVNDVVRGKQEAATLDADVAAKINDSASAARGALNAGFAPATGSTVYAATDSITAMSRASARRLDTSWVTAWQTTFQAGHGWTAYGGGSHASHNFNDTSDGYLGPQSVSITTLGTAGSGAYIEKTGLNLNMTGKHLVIPLKLSDWAKAGTFVVYLGTDASGYSNAYQWSVVQSGVAGKIGLHDSNQWVALTLSFSDAIVIGSPNRSTVQSIRLVANDNNTGPITAYWGGVGTVPDPVTAWPNGVISLTFDDSGNKQFTVAAPKLSQYGYRGTLYPILESTGLTQAQIRILHDRMGWEIGAHATTTAKHGVGLTGMSLADADQELRATRQYLLDNGYEADTFAYPLGATNAAVQNAVRKYFLAARGTYGNSIETWPPSNLMNLRSYNVGAYTLAQLKALADKVKTNRDWATFMIHDIPDTKAGSNDITRADFEAFVDYLATLGIPVMPVREVTRSFPASI